MADPNKTPLPEKTEITAIEAAKENFPMAEFGETFLARARVRSAISRLLLDTEIGKKLIASGFVTHPQLAEKDRQELRLDKLMLAYEKSGLFPDRDNLLNFVREEPDMLPIAGELVGFEQRVRAEKISDLDEKLGFNSYEVIKNMDFKIHLPVLSDPDAEENLVPKAVAGLHDNMQAITNGLVYSSLRDKVLELASYQNWPVLIDLIMHLHHLPATRGPVSTILHTLGPKLFQEKDFRKQLFYVLVKRICILDSEGFDSLSKFLVEHGFPLYSDQEKASYLNDHYIDKSLETSWRYNQEKYFQVVRHLYEFDVLSDRYLKESPAFRQHVIEFALRAMRRNTNYRTFLRDVKPLVIGVGVFTEDDLTLRNQYSLYSTYQSLCTTHHLVADQEITQMFRRQNHAAKWEE